MKKVFILDDNEELQDIVTRLLKKDYEVQGSTDTIDIIDNIVHFNPDLLILDHSIGDMNSADIIRELKINHPGFIKPVILFSAHPELKDLANAVGAVGFIDKPSDIAYIRNYIRRILEENT